MYLYCIANSSGLCKFGFSGDPLRRLRGLQTGSSEELFLIDCIAVPRDRVREYERLLHSEFAHRRVRGEWFSINAEEGALFLSWFEIHHLSD